MTDNPVEEVDQSSDIPTEALNDATEAAEAEPTATAEAAEPTESAESVDEAEVLRRQLAERTEDLQRLQAEYANYKRRVDRDRVAVKQSGADAVLRDLLPVWDSINAADKLGELVGGFKLTADEFVRLAEKHGLVQLGAVDELFDPTVHEALMQLPSEASGEPTIAEVIQHGYRVGDNLLRPARVVVTVPSGDEPVEQSADDTEHQ